MKSSFISSVFSFLKKNWLPLSFITILILMAYQNILSYEFVIDDIGNVDKFQHWKDLIPFFKSPAQSTRSFMYLLMYKAGNGSPETFHAVSLLFHIENIWLVYIIVSKMINRGVGFITALLAAVHPLFVEPVTWISGSPYVQYSFFALLSLLFYMHIEKKSITKDSKIKTTHTSIYMYIGSFCAFILATLMSEKAVVLPLLLMIYELSFGNIKKNWKRFIPFFAVSFIWAIFYLPMAKSRIVTHANEYHLQVGLDNPLIQIPVAISSYFQLIFWPDKLSIYHSELRFGWIDLSVRFVFLIAFLGSIGYFYKKNRIIFFWLAWFTASLIPTLLPVRLSWVFAERYAYLGTMGIIAIVALALYRLFLNKSYRVMGGIIIFGITSTLIIRTYVRNLDWQTEDQLWLATADASPSDFKTHNNVGTVYLKQGDNTRAEREFLLAISMNKHYADAYYNLGLLYMNNNVFDHAEKNYLRAIKEKPTFWQAYNGLSIIYIANQKFDKGEEYAKKTIFLQPSSPAGYNNLGLVYQVTGKYKAAIENFKKSIAINPQLWQTHLNLALLYYLDHDPKNMDQSIQKAKKTAPDTAEYHARLGQVYATIGNKEDAKIESMKAIQLNPVDPIAEQTLKSLNTNTSQ